MEAQKYSLIVIGGGPGGYVAAIRAAQLGMKTALVEDRDLGGTCLNRGCIPTKALLHSGELLETARDFASYGLKADNLGFDLGRIYENKNEIVNQLRGGIEALLKANGITVIPGKGRLLPGPAVEVSGQRLETDNVLIATGSRPAVPPIPGAGLSGVVTSDELLAGLDAMPRRVVIIGGGVIGVEFASVFTRLGASVSILEMVNRLLFNMDREISQSLAMSFKKKGISVITSAAVKEIAPGEPLRCLYETGGELKEAPADLVLIATGRRPNIEDLGLEACGVEFDRKGIRVDEGFRTNVPGVYACGDVTGGIQLAHMASAQGIRAVESMLSLPPSADLSTVPGCVYTNPEIASAGMTLEEAKAAGIDAKAGKFIMSANGKSLIERQERGFIKVVAESRSGRILGASLFCGRATDMVSELAAAVVNKLTLADLAKVIHPHPTFSEGMLEAVEACMGHGIHSSPKK